MRGIRDNIPPRSYGIEFIRKKFEKLSSLYGVDLIDLPIMEEASLYIRTSGEDSDICNKELFEVRRFKGEFTNWALRPEGTAGCMRAIREHNLMQQAKEWRLGYFCPMFRYNRPQSGRYRQFLQAGWEFIGNKEIECDAECIIAGANFIAEFEIDHVIEINTIGSVEDRKKYREILRKELKLEENVDPLKILDKMEEIDESIPKMEINSEDQKKFARLIEILENNKIDFKLNPFLIRGLDYYNATVFEIKEVGKETQGTLLAGGRYDSLMEQISGPKTPAVGFAAGVDRIANSMKFAYKNCKVGIVALDAPDYAFKIAAKQREEGKECFIFWGDNLKKIFDQANRQEFEHIIICGKKEEETGIYIYKNFKTKKEEKIKF